MDFTKMTDVDAAYYILQNNGEEPMYYKDLILKTIELKKKPVRNPENPEAEAISEIYTQINMDSRFFYVRMAIGALQNGIQRLRSLFVVPRRLMNLKTKS